MKETAIVIICFCMISTLVRGEESSGDFEKYWPMWRGPSATGVAPRGNPPIEWDENKNVRWKVEIPGKGSSSPIVWNNTIFVTASIETEKQVKPEKEQQTQERRRRGPPNITTNSIHKFVIFAVNRFDGKIMWQQIVREELPHEGTHPTGSWASNSPITNGEYVYAYFGSQGLYCFDMHGNQKWAKDFGDMTTRLSFGEGSSPVLYGDVIIVNWDHEGQSFIISLDRETGEEVWKVDRDEHTSWSTPIVVASNGAPQVITSATHRTRSYNLVTGKLIWECGGMTMNTIPSPVAENGIVYVTSGFRGNALQAIRWDGAQGDITGSEAIVWEYNRDTPYVPSPLLYNDTLYFLKSNNGILSCFDAKTGQAHYGPQRLDGIADVYASPVGADHRVYLVGRNGTTLVIKHGPEFMVLAENRLDDGFDASPAIVEHEIYLRGQRYLYCIASE